MTYQHSFKFTSVRWLRATEAASMNTASALRRIYAGAQPATLWCGPKGSGPHGLTGSDTLARFHQAIDFARQCRAEIKRREVA